jgi:hypothetical protein
MAPSGSPATTSASVEPKAAVRKRMAAGASVQRSTGHRVAAVWV